MVSQTKGLRPLQKHGKSDIIVRDLIKQTSDQNRSLDHVKRLAPGNGRYINNPRGVPYELFSVWLGPSAVNCVDEALLKPTLPNVPQLTPQKTVT